MSRVSVGRQRARHGIESGPEVRRLVVIATLLLAAALPARADFKAGEAAHGRGDFAAALREFRPLALAGNAQAQFYLGFIYRNGQGTREDFAEAVKWYRRAALQRVPGAQFNLGLMYDNGQGVPQDFSEAIDWYLRAAEQGVAGAQFNLGLKYRDGEGVPPDLAQAHFWFNLATATARPNEALQYMAFNQRRILAQRLSSAQLKRAQGLAKEWWTRHGR